MQERDLEVLTKEQGDAIRKAYALKAQERDWTVLLIEDNLAKYGLSSVRATAKIVHYSSLAPDLDLLALTKDEKKASASFSTGEKSQVFI